MRNNYAGKIFKNYISQFKKHITCLIIINLLVTLFLFMLPKMFQVLIDKVFILKQTQVLFLICICFVLVNALIIILDYVKLILENKIYKRINVSIRKDIWSKIINLSFTEKELVGLGDAKQRVIDDINIIGTYVKEQVIDRYFNYITLILSTVLIFVINPILSLISLTLIPIIVLISYQLSAKSSEVNNETRSVNEKYYSFAYNSIRMWREIKINNCEDTFINKFSDYKAQLSKLGMKSIKYWGLGEIFNDFKNNYMSKVVIYLLGLLLVINNQLTVGSLIMFGDYYMYCFDAVNAIINKKSDIKKNEVHYEKVYRTLQNNVLDNKCNIDIKGNISVNNLMFSYDNKNIIEYPCIEINAGEKLAIIGNSGCGKTTLIKLLLGMLNRTNGEILYDGHQVSDFNVNGFFTQVSAVMQDSYMFNLSIKENLKLSNLDICDQLIEKCCKIACINDYIQSLPEKYNTIIGDKGMKLSGGQKQRLAIARALIINPKILFLDESTSSLDEKTENQIFKNILSSYPDMTLIVVSHKPSIINLMDRIINI